MREIKFRIVYQHEDTGRITTRIVNLGVHLPELGKRWFVVAKEQYTGLKDKNGVEIYEGDIVKAVMGGLDRKILTVVWGGYWGYSAFGLEGNLPNEPNKVGKSWDLLGKAWKPNHLEVIGNIHENPELLEAKK